MKGLRFCGLFLALIMMIAATGCEHYHHSEVMSETVVDQVEVVE
ncbi:MAG: hypothetical protein Q8Q33_02455 [Chlamydiota bacterium]|nr:hypothetical protein [Chlamydiota bacterium]